MVSLAQGHIASELQIWVSTQVVFLPNDFFFYIYFQEFSSVTRVGI